MPHVKPATFRCPTCRAQQELSDMCRRCKCDLRLLRAAEQAYNHHRTECLSELKNNRPISAMACARECDRLRPGEESRKLLSVCSLVAGDWATALSVAGAP